MVQTSVIGSQPESLDGMLNAIRFVAPMGGGLAFDALTACLNVQSVPQTDPSVSAVDVTVNVIAVAGVRAEVNGSEDQSITDPGPMIMWSKASSLAVRDPVAHFGLPWIMFSLEFSVDRFCPNPASATKTPTKQNTKPVKPRRLKKAEHNADLFFMSK